MKVLVFTNTPAQVHVYKNLVVEFEHRGHDVLVLARDYGCTKKLLDWYELPYRIYGACGTTKCSLLRRLPGQYKRMIREARRFEPEFILGHGAYAAHTGLATGARTALVTDSEPETLDIGISRPFVDFILTPNTYRKDLGPKHYVFDGFTECAYLHPDVFSPADDIRENLGIADGPYTVVRFNAFGSHHDVGETGFSTEQRRRLIERLAESTTVFVSDEGSELDLESLPARPYDVHPARVHDVLAEAELLVADTQTMVTEAALLGTPAIRSNSFVGDDDMGNFLELERQGLIFNIADFDETLDRATSLLAAEATKERWRERRNTFVDEMVNLRDLLVEFALDPTPERVDGLSKRSASPVLM